MRIIILTPIRVLGDGLAACLSRYPDMSVCAIVSDLAALRQSQAETSPDLVLVDVTQGVDLYDIRSLALECSGVALVALGINEQRQEIIRCGKAGFTGYVARDATAESLCTSLADLMQGRLACPAEISGGLLRALFPRNTPTEEAGPECPLTQRESDVLKLIGRGFSNKEIARDLFISVATVKHHVHNVLGKLNLPRRAQAMRRVRDAPWIASPVQGASKPAAGGRAEASNASTVRAPRSADK